MRKILFIDRDGTLITEPADFQIDSLEKFQLVDHAISALLRLKSAGYRFVMVSNQDGLGTDSFPEHTFWPAQNLLLQILSSQGIVFDDILIDRSFEHEHSPSRKPGIGMIQKAAAELNIDLAQSWMIGDTTTDIQTAKNAGLRSILVRTGAGGGDGKHEAKADFVVANLEAAVQRILEIADAH